MNTITPDQTLNLGASLILFVLALIVFFRLPYSRGLGASLIILSLFDMVFYSIIVFTDLNEVYHSEFSSISGYRSLFTLAILCGICVGLLRIGRNG